MNALEWLTYTVTIETAGSYDIEVRVASAVGGGRFQLQIDGEQIGEDLIIPNTGGWQNWISVWLRDVSLPAGVHTLKLLTRTAGGNVNRLRFSLLSATEVEHPIPVPGGVRLLGHYPHPFADEAQIAFYVDTAVRARLEVFNILGRKVFDVPEQPFAGGEHTLMLRPDLAPGAYFFRLIVDDGLRPQSFTRPMIVVR